MSSAPPPLPIPGKNRFAQIARYSWASFVISCGANVIWSAIGKQYGFEIPRVVIGVIVSCLALSGIVAGIIAFFGIGKYGRKGILWPAVTGICLWLVSFALAVPAFLIIKKTTALAKSARSLRQPAVHAPSAERVEDAGKGFAFDLPEGYVPFDSATKPKEYSHAFLLQAPNEVNRVLLVKPFSGVLGRERLRPEEIPAGKSLTLMSFNWRGLEIDGIRVPEKLGQEDYVTYNVQVPLVKGAIQLGFGGPLSAEPQMRKLVDQVLSSLDGETNW